MPADTLQNIIIIPPYNDADTLIDLDLEHALEAAYSSAGTDLEALAVEIPAPPPSWRDGLEGIPRHTNVGHNSGVLTIVTGIFVVMLLGYRDCRRLFASLFRDLLGLRRRANAFDERTSNETRMMALMAVQWSVYIGLLLYSLLAWQHKVDNSDAFLDTVKLIALTGAYYVFQLCAYSIVGYTFASPSGRKYFVQGFLASQSLLGFLLIIPALVAIFYQSATAIMLYLAFFLYFLARFTFIAKGFRIFYQKIGSLLYFILYLCTLEIIPIIILYKIALFLVNSH